MVPKRIPKKKGPYEAFSFAMVPRGFKEENSPQPPGDSLEYSLFFLLLNLKKALKRIGNPLKKDRNPLNKGLKKDRKPFKKDKDFYFERLFF